MAEYKAQQLIRAQTLELIEKPIPQTLDPDSVLVRVKIAGICGSDIEYFNHGSCGAFVPRGPLVLGHEFCGEIVALGARVTTVSVGQAVVVDPTIPCSNCNYCRTGHYNFCSHMKVFGSASSYPHLDGGLAQYVIVPAKNCLVFDKNKISWNLACLVEPLMVALAALDKIDFLQYKDVVVFGGGTIGQLILGVLKLWGANSISLIDPRKEAHEFANKRNITNCFTPDQIKEEKFDLCIEAAGNAQALYQAFMISKKMATLIQVGTIAQEVSLPVNLVMSKELTIRGSFRYAHKFKKALDLISNNNFEISDLVTHTVPLSNLKKGFELLADPSIKTLKVQVNTEE